MVRRCRGRYGAEHGVGGVDGGDADGASRIYGDEALDSSISAGGSDTFTVQMSTSAAGTFEGDISITNNDGTVGRSRESVSTSASRAS